MVETAQEEERERQMTVNCSVDQSVFTQYHQDNEERRKEGVRGGERRGSKERRGDTKDQGRKLMPHLCPHVVKT